MKITRRMFCFEAAWDHGEPNPARGLAQVSCIGRNKIGYVIGCSSCQTNPSKRYYIGRSGGRIGRNSPTIKLGITGGRICRLGRGRSVAAPRE